MALQWFNPVKTKPKPKRHPQVAPPPAFAKNDLVYVLGMTGMTGNTYFHCEVINTGYRTNQREYIYFCKTVDNLASPHPVIMCKEEYIRKPKFRAGTKLRVRDLDDRVNGVGIASDWKVSIECLEFVNGKFVYWIKIPGAGRKQGGLLLDVEESKLEMMAAAVRKRRKTKR